MAFYNYFLFDGGARLVKSKSAEHSDILDAFEQARALLDAAASIAMVQLWQHENFIGHIDRADGRLILKRQADSLPAHPVFAHDPPETKTG